MKLSIIIPLYNKEKHVERCLKSLMAQDISPSEYEIIIVDDGSKDSGAQVVQQYAEIQGNANIQLICQKNQGPSVARNRGLEEATGDYVYFLDADDYLATNVLNCLYTLCHQNNLEILEFDTKELKEGAPQDESYSSPQKPQELGVPVMDGITYIAKHDFRNQAWRYFIKRNFLLDTDIRFLAHMRAYEDLIFNASVFLRANRISKVNLDVHRYVLVAGSIVRSKDPKKNIEFINGMVKAIEELHVLIDDLNSSHEYYAKVVNKLKVKQQAVVFALIIRAFKYRLHSWKNINLIFAKLKKLGAYPIDPKIGGIGSANRIHNMIFVPIFNNKTCLFMSLNILRFIAPR
ncbi:glycosyltransferase [Arenibacter troitsensis]|uniref:Glycosyltransferase involved in cell wall bisynthesis n=1 Tax=Arenibacter troitsensis TaxID=188872 RepID=A0A1X7IYY8_9FLAO|nr:glycosyltransferase [Arenibacter troitsensis]SMG20410.1 Glycosyltransferase involved in cell wall bisynthesis [Arenibacter troitsensis]